MNSNCGASSAEICSICEAPVHWLTNGSITVAIRSPVNYFPWLLNRSCGGRSGAPVNKIDIGEVHIERATDGLTIFEGSHHGNERSRRDGLSYTLVRVWQVVPIQQLGVERVSRSSLPK